ncbi:hypothetical protein AUJ84_03695 [Candidatus Pacearchaeota archaeon CG1_02_32_132]|nr:MAG: hypothetical protein AUJ84_03695 [Candidatus Pacearchaeota archaeon CG1_02_32_132]
MQDDKIKEAFQKVKEDIDNLYYSYQHLNTELADIKDILRSQNQELQEIKANIEEYKNVSFNLIKRTQEIKTQVRSNLDTPSFPVDTSIDTSTHNLPLEAVKSQIIDISTRNEGVKTDRQTDKQTDNTLNKIPEVLESLTKIKEEVRFKFKQLTKQEIAIFALIYQLEEQDLSVDYHLLAQKLSITESSVRDHIGRIIRKGIPVEKTKENNKKILLKISKSLKEIASLDSILNLRETRLTE